MEVPISFQISEIPLFDCLNVQEIKSIQKWFIRKEVKKGSVVYKQGTDGRSVCFVVEGELSVIKRREEGDVTIATVSKGESVGEMALIDGLTRSADVLAASDASLLLLKREDFDAMTAELPDISVKVLKSLARALSMTLRDRSEVLARLMHV